MFHYKPSMVLHARVRPFIETPNLMLHFDSFWSCSVAKYTTPSQIIKKADQEFRFAICQPTGTHVQNRGLMMALGHYRISIPRGFDFYVTKLILSGPSTGNHGFVRQTYKGFKWFQGGPVNFPVMQCWDYSTIVIQSGIGLGGNPCVKRLLKLGHVGILGV